MSVEEDQDEAIGRLGGPSKISKLEKTLAEAIERMDRERTDLKDKLTKAIRYNRVTIGAEVYLSANYGTWHGEGSQGPTGSFEIVALGHQWCVVRGTADSNKGEVWCRIGWGIREDLVTTLSHDVDLTNT